MSERPNVVWVTVDSVRADHTTLGGYGRETTPELERIAGDADGQAFDACISHGIWTLASSASILTGTYPSHNTVGMDGSTVPDSLRTVAERLREVGYRTACLSRNSHVSEATGLARGFDRFEWLAASTLLSAAGPRTLAKYLLNIRKHSIGLSPDTAKHATPYLMNDVAKRWLRDLESGGDDPFFFYLHYNEPHRPYVPPRPYLDAFTDDIEASPSEAVEVAMDIHYSLSERVANGLDLSRFEREAMVAMYDAEIAYTDAMVGRLFDHVRSLDVGPTVFVVTADHGELLGEHGLLAHKLVLDDALVNVPLVVHGADLDAERTDLVQHADLMGTLVSRVGGDTDGMQGVDLDAGSREFAVSQRAPDDFSEFTDINPAFDTSRFHGPLLTALRTREYKYQRSDDGADLFALPDECTDVGEEYPEVAARLDGWLDEWLDEYGAPLDEAADAAFTDAMRRQLADLGYID